MPSSNATVSIVHIESHPDVMRSHLEMFVAGKVVTWLSTPDPEARVAQGHIDVRSLRRTLTNWQTGVGEERRISN